MMVATICRRSTTLLPVALLSFAAGLACSGGGTPAGGAGGHAAAGGAAGSGGGRAGAGVNIGAAAAPAKRGAFVTALLGAMTSLGYDGIDLDWEDSVNLDDLVALAQALRAARPGMLLTYPAGALNANIDTVDPRMA